MCQLTMHEVTMIRRLSLSLLILPVMCFAAACLPGFANPEETMIEIAGKVTNEHKAPVKRALVILTDRNSGAAQKTHTDRLGHFTFSHPLSGLQSLQVIPAAKTNMAQAVLTDLPGDEPRHVLISVRKGVTVAGRVLFRDKPLKNVTVRVRTHDGDTVHGGGQTVTDGKGVYQLVLTPGEKTFEVTDVANKESVGIYKENFHVTTPGTMPDLKLPASKTAGAAK
jgi:hypothetical protein